MSPLRGAIVGYGFISSKGHLPALVDRAARARNAGATPDIEVVAVADICDARRAAARAALPMARVYPDCESLLAAEAANLDFVDISTPPSEHAAIARAALDRGLHVICEKPLATSLVDARGMLEHAEAARRVLFPCHNYVHAPVVRAIGEIIAGGRIGKVRSLTLSTFRNTHARGVPEWRTDWRRERRYSGGGIAMDHGSHTFYLTFDWLGAYPTAITATMSNLGAWDTEDNFSAVLTFPGGLAHTHLSWTSGIRKMIYTVHGDRGAITVNDDELELAVMQQDPATDGEPSAVTWVREKRTISSHWGDASHVTWYNSLFDRFLAAIRRDEFVGKEAREAYLCLQVIMSAYESADSGCREMPLATLVPAGAR